MKLKVRVALRPREERKDGRGHWCVETSCDGELLYRSAPFQNQTDASRALVQCLNEGRGRAQTLESNC